MTLLKNNLATVIAYAAMCAIWGTTWLGIKISLEYLPPIAGVGLRFIIAGLALFLVSVFSREWQGWRQTPWRLVLVLAVFLFGANYVLTYVAETRLDSGLVAVLFGVAPFFIFWFGHMMIGERTNWRIWTGVLSHSPASQWYQRQGTSAERHRSSWQRLPPQRCRPSQ